MTPAVIQRDAKLADEIQLRADAVLNTRHQVPRRVVERIVVEHVLRKVEAAVELELVRDQTTGQHGEIRSPGVFSKVPICFVKPADEGNVHRPGVEEPVLRISAKELEAIKERRLGLHVEPASEAI